MQRGLATELNLLDKTTAAFLTSRDEGRTWTYLSHIPNAFSGYPPSVTRESQAGGSWVPEYIPRRLRQRVRRNVAHHRPTSEMIMGDTHMIHHQINFRTRISRIRQLLVWLLAWVLSAAGVSAAQEPPDTKRNTDWFLQAGSGVFVHYLNGLQNNRESINSLGKETSWDECVREFDTERFADAMQEAGRGTLSSR